MRITLLFLLAGFLNLIASESFSQQKKLSVSLKNATVEQVLGSIEDNSDYNFVYNRDFIDLQRKVNVDFSETGIDEILNGLFKETNVTFQLIDRTIVLSTITTNTSVVQSGTVSGKVTDSSGQPLPGVTVVVKGTTNGTITGTNGEYSLVKIPSDAILVFSFVGMKTQEVSVSGKSVIDVKLAEDAIGIEEVVAVGYGTMKKSDLTGSVVSISSKDINSSKSTSLDQALQGRAAGLVMTQNSGQPGGSISVRIRGINSLTLGNEPLYVIDGVPISPEFGIGSSRASGGDGTPVGSNGLSSINPSEIESMEVLKDASSAAIYGSRAANGVIIITTKKGTKGKPKVNFETSIGWQNVAKKLDMLNLQEYAVYDNARAKTLGLVAQPGLKDPSMLGNGTDWQNEIFRTAPIYNSQFNVSGGDERTVYSFSLGYLNQDGIVLGSEFKRYSTRLSIDNKTNDWLKIGANILFSQTIENVNATTSDNEITIRNTLLNTALGIPPDVPVRNSDGTWGGFTQDQMSLRYGSASYINPNPVALANILMNNLKRNSLIGKIYADISILKGLTFRNEFGGTLSNSTFNQFRPTFIFGVKDNPNNMVKNSADNALAWTFNNYLMYNKTFSGGTNLTLMAAHEIYLSQYEGFNVQTLNLSTNYIPSISLGDITTAKLGDYKGADALESYFGRLIFTMKDKYILTATMRTDGSSKFGPNNKWGYFPSAAFAWKVSKEPFLKDIKEIDNLKLRLSYGMVGNSAIPIGTFIPSLMQHNTSYGIGFLSANIPNTDVRWESTASVDIGLDLIMFNSRLEFIFDVFSKKTDNLLLQATLPMYLGTSGTGSLSAPYVNIGQLENKGLDFTLNTVNIHGDFTWKTSFTYTLSRNKVLKMYTQNSLIDLSLGSGHTRTAVGQPVGMFYGYETDGLFKTGDEVTSSAIPAGLTASKGAGVWVGDVKFKDRNRDGYIDQNDQTYIGDPNPKWTAGISNIFTYKNFDMTIFITGVFGNKIYNNLRNSYGGPVRAGAGLSSIINYAKDELIDLTKPGTIDNVRLSNPETDIFRVTNSDYNGNFRTSDLWVEDGSYLRVKNITLGYKLPKKFTNKLHIDNLRIYGNVQNAFTFTKYSGYDPEIGSFNGNMLLSGIDAGRYPSARTYLLGIDVNF